MADFEAVTASSGVKIPQEQCEGVQGLLNQYEFGEVTAEIDDEGYLYIYGYEWLQAHHPAAEPGTRGDDDATEEFLDRLREFIPKAETFEIHMIGHEKCRFPLSMSKVEVRREEVTWTNL